MSITDLGFAGRSRTLDPTTRGVLAMVAGMGCQAVNDTVVKLAAARLPTHEIMALRGVLAIALTLAAIVATGQWRGLRSVGRPLVVLPSVMEACACFVYVTALSGLGLAEFTSIIQATPLIITALAVALGWQSVGVRRWAAIGAGFVGVLLVAKPSIHGVNAYAALALLAACIMAGRDLVTSRLPPAAGSLVVTLGATISVTCVGLALGVANPETWVVPDPYELALIGGAALLVVACNMTIVLAFRLGDMTVVGPFRYSVILAALLLGYAVWGDRPDALALIGAALIVGSGLYALRRERLKTSPGAAQSVAGVPTLDL